MNEMHIRSMALVAFLRLQGIDPSGTQLDANDRIAFFFARTPELLTAMDAYKTDAISVSARVFAQALHDIKKTYLPRYR